jgi:DNA-binding PadR family transcriptional regulator
MAKYRYKGRAWRDMYIPRELFMSLAWLSLPTDTACKVYIIFRSKCRMEPVQGNAGKKRKGAYVIGNNGQIQFTYKEAFEKYGFTDGKFRRAIDQLVAAGLIDITHSATGMQKETSLYAISERWRAWGTDKFKWILRQRRKAFSFPKGNKYGQRCTEKKMSTVTDNSSPTVTNNCWRDNKP